MILSSCRSGTRWLLPQAGSLRLAVRRSETAKGGTQVAGVGQGCELGQVRAARSVRPSAGTQIAARRRASPTAPAMSRREPRSRQAFPVGPGQPKPTAPLPGLRDRPAPGGGAAGGSTARGRRGAALRCAPHARRHRRCSATRVTRLRGFWSQFPLPRATSALRSARTALPVWPPPRAAGGREGARRAGRRCGRRRSDPAAAAAAERGGAPPAGQAGGGSAAAGAAATTAPSAPCGAAGTTAPGRLRATRAASLAPRRVARAVRAGGAGRSGGAGAAAMLEEAGEVLESVLKASCLPLSFLLFVPAVLLLLGPPPAAEAAHEFTVYRMQQYELGGQPYGETLPGLAGLGPPGGRVPAAALFRPDGVPGKSPDPGEGAQGRPRSRRRAGEGDPAQGRLQESSEGPGRLQTGLGPGPDPGEAAGSPHQTEF